MNTYNVPTTIKTLEDADTLLFVWTRLEKEFADRVEEAKELIRANNGSTHFKLKGGGNRTNIDWQAAAESSVPLPVGMPTASRPFWLLEQPLLLVVRQHRPFYGSLLRLLSGPERIEAGWWDGELALRDYFVAEGEEGACYWVYRERDAGSARWFLHGLFG
jgi:hypothetical protein